VRRGRSRAVGTNRIARALLYRAGLRSRPHRIFSPRGGFADDGGPRRPQPVMMLWFGPGAPPFVPSPATFRLARKALAQLTRAELIVTGPAAGIAVAGSPAHFAWAPAGRARDKFSGLNPALPFLGEDGSSAGEGHHNVAFSPVQFETLRTEGIRRPAGPPGPGGYHGFTARGARAGFTNCATCMITTRR